ncbi:hypothetical protein ACM55F_11595 [Flavobacterium sp. XS2P12]|uniref:hypothetical protein n=1 Tax=Flavobacterium melibiosi TaxID=3398734 RepID=UPI003A8A850B
MKYNIQLSRYSIQWTGFILLLFSFIFSCKNYENKKQEVETLPTGKWKIIQLKNPQVNIVFDTTRTYFLEHYAKDTITITAEDNSLSGELIVLNKDSFKMGTLAVTDVCCNSEDAKLLFSFFYDTLKQEQLGNKLILSSNKTVVTLEK